MTNGALAVKLADSAVSMGGSECEPFPHGFAPCNDCDHFSGAGADTNASRLAISSRVTASSRPSGISDTVYGARLVMRALVTTTGLSGCSPVRINSADAFSRTSTPVTIDPSLSSSISDWY